MIKSLVSGFLGGLLGVSLASGVAFAGPHLLERDMSIDPSGRTHAAYQKVYFVKPSQLVSEPVLNPEWYSFDLTNEKSRAKLRSNIEESLKLDIEKDLKKALKVVLSKLALIEEGRVENLTQSYAAIYELLNAVAMTTKVTIKTKLPLRLIIKRLGDLYNGRVGNNPKLTPLSGVSESSFWNEPKKISELDFAAGFGRTKLPNYLESVFEYHKAKTGWGIHAGFRVKRDATEYKVRIGEEAQVALFSTRIVDALGFNTLPMDYSPYIRVKYDRRILKEYNSRQGYNFKVTALGVPLLKRSSQKHYDPFVDIVKVKLSDGRVISGSEAKGNLLVETEVPKTETRDENYNVKFESQIAELWFGPVTVEKLNDDEHSVGPWDWNDRIHTQRRELRGYGLLAAWLGQYDARTENTRLYLVENKDQSYTIKHVINDVGSGLGGASGLFNFRKNNIKKFRDFFLEVDNKGNIVSRAYVTISKNLSFQSMTLDDAKWMANYINQISENQIKDALLVSGYDEDLANQFTKKLILRRQNMNQVIEEATNWIPTGQSHFEPGA